MGRALYSGKLKNHQNQMTEQDAVFIDWCKSTRVEIKTAAAQVWSEIERQKQQPLNPPGEQIANLILAFRHLEDAAMRLGKAIQAADGGISVYDK